MQESEFIVNRGHDWANIHGVVGRDETTTCRTPSGKLCTGCCYALHIQEDNKPTKEAGQLCPSQIPGQGCEHVINQTPNARFSVCPQYHCCYDVSIMHSDDITNESVAYATQRVFLSIQAAYMNGEITRDEALESLAHHQLPEVV